MKKFIVLCAMLFLPMVAAAGEHFAVVYKSQSDFAFVNDLVKAGIEGKGLKINHKNFIADMLDRTGKDLGFTKQVYVNGEQYEFCSATLSRQMMEADPHAISLCPFIINVYTLPNDSNVYVSYRKPPATKNQALKKTLAEIEKLMVSIIKEAL